MKYEAMKYTIIIITYYTHAASANHTIKSGCSRFAVRSLTKDTRTRARIYSRLEFVRIVTQALSNDIRKIKWNRFQFWMDANGILIPSVTWKPHSLWREHEQRIDKLFHNVEVEKKKCEATNKDINNATTMNSRNEHIFIYFQMLMWERERARDRRREWDVREIRTCNPDWSL